MRPFVLLPPSRHAVRTSVMRCGSCSIFNLRRAVQRRALHARDAAWKRRAVCEESEDHGLRSAACRERWVVEEMHCVAFVSLKTHIKNGEEHSKNTAITLLWEFGHSHSHIPKPAHCSMDSCVDHGKHPDDPTKKCRGTKKACFCGGAPSGSSDSKPPSWSPHPNQTEP